MLNFENIGPALRHLRQDRGLKQAEVAEGAGITSPMLSAYETGKQRPGFATIDKILDSMGFDAVDLTDALRAANRAQNPQAEDEDLDSRLSRLRQTKIESSQLGAAEEELVENLLPTVLWVLRHLRE